MQGKRITAVIGSWLTPVIVFTGIMTFPGTPWASGVKRGEKPMEQAQHEGKKRERPPEGHNRLIFEKSPYLLQHADNPVDWYPWGPEAFEKARREA
jgi:hypothetical protein